MQPTKMLHWAPAARLQDIKGAALLPCKLRGAWSSLAGVALAIRPLLNSFHKTQAGPLFTRRQRHTGPTSTLLQPVIFSFPTVPTV